MRADSRRAVKQALLSAVCGAAAYQYLSAFYFGDGALSWVGHAIGFINRPSDSSQVKQIGPGRSVWIARGTTWHTGF